MHRQRAWSSWSWRVFREILRAVFTACLKNMTIKEHQMNPPHPHPPFVLPTLIIALCTSERRDAAQRYQPSSPMGFLLKWGDIYQWKWLLWSANMFCNIEGTVREMRREKDDVRMLENISYFISFITGRKCLFTPLNQI